MAVPGQPVQIRVQGKGKMITAYPEVNGYFSIKGEQWTAAAFSQRAPITPANNCATTGSTPIGQTQFLGHKVFQYRIEHPSGTRLEWVAPGLNCAALRQEFRWGTSITYKVASQVVVGAAPESIWDPPVGSIELSPLDLYHTVHVGRLKQRGLSDADAEAKWVSTMKPQFEQMAAQMQQKWISQHTR